MMQLFIKGSNSLHLLVDTLVDTAMVHPATGAPAGDSANSQDIFTPIFIVTQTDGMQSWLKMQIAEKTGIAANLVFLKPNELINKLYQVTGGKYESTLSAADIQWLIYQALTTSAVLNGYPTLANYYQTDGNPDNVRRIALANKLSDLFDQYQIYRPNMLKGWEHGKLSTKIPDERWQMDIWNIVRVQAGHKFPDKSRIKQTIIANLANPMNTDELKRRIPAVHFFGTSLITSFHFDILQAIALHIPINFYLPNPAPQLYWYDDRSKKAMFYARKRGIPVIENAITNPLLINWGKLIQHTFSLLFQSDDALNHYEEIEYDTAGATLLSSVQRLIHDNAIPGKENGALFTKGQLNDGSIVIKSCFSAVREVETLYNYLVKLIDDHPGMFSPRDIVVHVTDINPYASYIRSVFDNAPYPLRYTIADESFTEADTISQALYEILTLDERDFTSEKVVQLLHFSSVRKHFQITDTDLIREIVSEANIRHGIEGEVEDESVYVSWEYGLKRIMYGICISSDEEYGTGETGFYTVDSVEGGEANEVIRFVFMVEKLIRLTRERDRDRTVPQWIDYIQEVLHHLIFDEEEKDNPEFRQLSEHIHTMEVEEQLFSEPVSYQVFLRQFLRGLSEMAQSYRFARSGITFCSLIPMRSIPFKIVAMLGLDFDKFPRKPVRSGFDLMLKSPEPGDRNIRTNDKHLFLETLMSAEEYLYLSYTGQQIKDNSKLPPSILVDELLSFITASSEEPAEVREALLTEEPLHGFSAKYGNDPRYYTFLLETGRAKKIPAERVRDEPEDKMLLLSDIYRFLADSISWYYKNVVGIYYDDSPVTLPESESFELDNLEKWKLKNGLLLIDPGGRSGFTDQQKKKGVIPLKSAGLYEVQVAGDEASDIKSQFDIERAGNDEKVGNLNIEIGDYQITARIDFVFGNKIIVPCFSKNPKKYLLRAWLNMLAVQAAGKNYDVLFIGNEKKFAKPVTQQEAIKTLSKLLSSMEEGKREMMLFNIDWFNFQKRPDGNGKIEKAITDAAYPYERAKREPDKYAQLALRDGLPENLLERYNKIADILIPSITQTFESAE